MKKVLFVDDEAYVLKVIERKFESSNIKCYFSTSVSEAVKVLKSNDIDVLVTDIQMPDYNGIKFSKLVSEISPRTIRIILSGCSRVASIIEAINEGHVYKYIEKPWNIDQAGMDLIEEAIQRSKKYISKLTEELYLPVNELNKFQEYDHWVLVDTLDQVVYQNSDYPLNDNFEKKQFTKIKSNLGELKLFSAE